MVVLSQTTAARRRPEKLREPGFEPGLVAWKAYSVRMTGFATIAESVAVFRILACFKQIFHRIGYKNPDGWCSDTRDSNEDRSRSRPGL